MELLRVPGLGHVTVENILNLRREVRISSIDSPGKMGKRLSKADGYIEFGV